INPTQDINAAPYRLTPDTGGTIVVRKGADTFDFNWNAATTTVQSVLTFLQGAGLTAAYDAHDDRLTVSGGPFTLYEVTNTGGNGFFAVNGLNVTTTGQSYAGSTTSTGAAAA